MIRQSVEKISYAYSFDATRRDPMGLCNMTQSFCATSSSTSERQHRSRIFDLSKGEVRYDTPAARRLINEGKRVKGVELMERRKMFARKAVVTCCGTQKSLQLLILSGIGLGKELERRMLEVVAGSPGVGQNLMDHLALTMYFELKYPERGESFTFIGTMKLEYGQGMLWK